MYYTLETRLEKQTTKSKEVKEIVETITISFFFSVFFLFIFLMTGKNDLDKYLNLLNFMAVDVKEISENNINIDIETKKIIDYPKYGEIYADLIINSIKLNTPVYHGDDYNILNKGVGHYAGSMFPGENGSIILASHNSKQFKNLYDVNINDEVILRTNYGTFKYKIYETKVIKYNDNDALPIKYGEEILMMYTCYPRNVIGFAEKRFVVYAKLVEANYEEIRAN